MLGCWSTIATTSPDASLPGLWLCTVAVNVTGCPASGVVGWTWTSWVARPITPWLPPPEEPYAVPETPPFHAPAPPRSPPLPPPILFICVSTMLPSFEKRRPRTFIRLSCAFSFAPAATADCPASPVPPVVASCVPDEVWPVPEVSAAVLLASVTVLEISLRPSRAGPASTTEPSAPDWRESTPMRRSTSLHHHVMAFESLLPVHVSDSSTARAGQSHWAICCGSPSGGLRSPGGPIAS